MIIYAGTFHLVTIRVLEGARFAETDQRRRPWSGTCAGEIHRHLEAQDKTDMPARLLPPLEAVLSAWKPWHTQLARGAFTAAMSQLCTVLYPQWRARLAANFASIGLRSIIDLDDEAGC